MVSLIPTDLHIAPFHDPVGELPMLDTTLRGFVDRALDRAKLPNLDLVLGAHVLITAPMIRAFAAAAKGQARPLRLALPEDSPMRALTPVSSVERKDGLLLYDVFLGEEAPLETLRANAKPARVHLQQPTMERALHRAGPPPHELLLPAGGAVVAHIEHWVHLLWTAPLLVPALRAYKPGKRYKKRPSPLVSYIGEGATIHPSAYLEGSIIGPGVEVGAECSIRHSYVGPNSIISDSTMVLRSVLGEETHTLVDARFCDVVSLGRGTLASMGLKDVLLGRDVFITSGVIFWSEALEGTISVLRDGQPVDTERKALGGCAGHGCVLGARTIVAPGSRAEQPHHGGHAQGGGRPTASGPPGRAHVLV